MILCSFLTPVRLCGMNFMHIFLFPKSSRRIWHFIYWLMCSWSKTNFWVIWLSLATISRNSESVSIVSALYGCPLLCSPSSCSSPNRLNHWKTHTRKASYSYKVSRISCVSVNVFPCLTSLMFSAPRQQIKTQLMCVAATDDLIELEIYFH